MRQKFRQHDTRGEVWEVNRLQMRMRRNRSSFFQLCWDTRPNGGQSEQSRVLALIPGINQDSNSTRGLTPGMIDPARGENGGRVPAPRPERIVWPQALVLNYCLMLTSTARSTRRWSTSGVTDSTSHFPSSSRAIVHSSIKHRRHA